MARSKLTPEVTARICESLRAGAARVDAATIAGISESTFYGWLQQAERGSKRHLVFSEDIKEAEAEFAAEAASHIRKVSLGGELITRETTTRRDGTVVTKESYAPPEWTAAAWLLERKWPSRWGRHDRVTVELQQAFGQQQEAVRALFAKLEQILTPAQKAEVTAFLMAARPVEALPLGE